MNNLFTIAVPQDYSLAQLNDHRSERGAFYSLLILLFFGPLVMNIWFGLEIAVVASSSMEPAISAGDLEITALASAADIKIGDVILLEESKNASVYSHRVTEVKHQSTGVLIQTRGDANQVEDATIASIPKDSTIPKTVFVIPKLGYLVSFLTSVGGKFVIGLVVSISSVLLIIQSIQTKNRLGKTDENLVRR